MLPPATNGAQIAFSIKCKGTCGKVQAYQYTGNVTRSGVVFHRYGCPEQKCKGTIEVQIKTRRTGR